MVLLNHKISMDIKNYKDYEILELYASDVTSRKLHTSREMPIENFNVKRN